MRCWWPKADVGIHEETPVNWGLEGHDADKHGEYGAFIVKLSAEVEGCL